MAPRITEVRTAAPNVIAVIMNSGVINQNGSNAAPEPLDLTPQRWQVNGVTPIGVFRYSLPIDALPALPGDLFPTITEHRIYLRLSANLTANSAYYVVSPYGNSSLNFKPRDTFCESIKVNQLGYSKIGKSPFANFGVYMGNGGSVRFPLEFDYEVVNATSGQVVLTGKSTYMSDETPIGPVNSGEHVYRLKLAGVPEGGPYFVSVPSAGRSRTFGIGDAYSRESARVALFGLTAKRCGAAQTSDFTEFTRAICHTKMADTRRPWVDQGFIQVPDAMPRVPAAGGYHDAGDFDQRPQHTIVGVVGLTAYTVFKDRFKALQFPMPEKDALPSFLNEMLWAVRGWETLQINAPTDAEFGGVRAGREKDRHPIYGEHSAANDPGTYGTWGVLEDITTYVAGIFAHAARAVAPFDKPRSDRYLDRARMAYQYLTKRNLISAQKSATVYMALQLYAATGEQVFHDLFKASITALVINGGSWPRQWLPGNYSADIKTEHFIDYLFLPDRPTDATIVQSLTTLVFQQADRGGYMEFNTTRQAYPHGVTKFLGYGSATAVGRYALAGYAALLTQDATKRQGYLDTISHLGDYLGGLNPMGLCWMVVPGIVDQPQSPLDLDAYFTKYGKSDGVTSDHLNKPIGNVPGWTSYGPAEGRSGAPYQLAGTNPMSPGWDQTNLERRFAGPWNVVNCAESTCHEVTIWNVLIMTAMLYNANTDTTLPPPDDEIVNKKGPHGESVGRQVHYVAPVTTSGATANQIVSGLVTQLNDNGTVRLKVFYPSGVVEIPSVEFSDTYKQGFWSWPVIV